MQLIWNKERMFFNRLVLYPIFQLKSDAYAPLSTSSSYAPSINLHSHNIMSEHCQPRTGLKKSIEFSFCSRQERVHRTLNSNTVQSNRKCLSHHWIRSSPIPTHLPSSKPFYLRQVFPSFDLGFKWAFSTFRNQNSCCISCSSIRCKRART
jgi:hypothetical protein